MELTDEQSNLIKNIPFLMAAQQTPNTSNSLYGRAYLNGAENAVKSAWTKVTLDTKSFSSGITCDLTNHRFTALTAGYYFVNGMVTYQSYESGKSLVVGIYLNGSNTVYSLGAGFVVGNLATQRVSDLIHLNVGDYVELYTYNNFSADAALQNGSTYTFLDIFLI